MMSERSDNPRLQVSEAGVGAFSDLERRSCSGARKVQVPPPAAVVGVDLEGDSSWKKEAEKSA